MSKLIRSFFAALSSMAIIMVAIWVASWLFTERIDSVIQTWNVEYTVHLWAQGIMLALLAVLTLHYSGYLRTVSPVAEVVVFIIVVFFTVFGLLCTTITFHDSLLNARAYNALALRVSTGLTLLIIVARYAPLVYEKLVKQPPHH
jgi:hypothetical protein